MADGLAIARAPSPCNPGLPSPRFVNGFALCWGPGEELSQVIFRQIRLRD